MQRTLAAATFLIAIIVLIAFEVNFTVTAAAGKGVVSIAFDDGNQNQYDNAFPLLNQYGMHATFYIITGSISDFSGNKGYMSIAELKNLQDNGNEIGSHSVTHPSFTSLTDNQIIAECSNSKQLLQSYGLTANNFAYPYGITNSHVDSIVSQYYRSGRVAYVTPYIMPLPTAQFRLQGYGVESGNTNQYSQYQCLQWAEGQVNQVVSTNGWEIFFFHNIIPNDTIDNFTMASSYFANFLSYVQSSGAKVLTVNQALDTAGPPLSASISPSSAKLVLGGTQTFTCSVSGGVSPYTYQWYLNGSPVTGATGSSWTFNPASTGTFQIYSRVVDSYTGNVQSNTATVSVMPGLVASITPTTVSIYLGQLQVFNSSVSGGYAPYSYQWYLNGSKVTGANASSWTFNAASTGTFVMFLKITDSNSMTAQSNSATMTVWAPITGLVNLVVRGEDNCIYYRTYNTSTGSWAGWTALPGATSDSPAADLCGNELHIIVRGINGNTLWHGYVNLLDNSFSGWKLLDGSTPSTPTITGNSTAISLVVRGGDNRIYYRFYTLSTQTWTSWAALPSGSTLESPAAALVGNTLHIVVKGLYGATLWYSNINPTTSAFSGWTLLSGSTPSVPTLTLNGTALSLVVRGGDNHIYYQFYTIATQAWTSWTTLPSGTTPDSPAATITGDTLYIAVRGMDGSSLWTCSIDLAASEYHSWTLLSGSTPSAPTLAS